MTNEELVVAYQAGEAQIMDVWKRMRKALRYWARRCSDDKDEQDDLIQEGFFGLVSAANNFDPAGGASFFTYASYFIRAAMQRYLQTNGVVRLPINKTETLRKYKRMCNSFLRDYNREPTDEEILAAIGTTREELEQMELASKVRSTDAIIPGTEDLTVADTIPDETDVEAEALGSVAAEELRNKIWSLVDTLPEQQAQVIRERYKEGKTLQQCGEDLEVSASRVQVIEVSALRRLRNWKVRRELEPYLDDMRYSVGLRGCGVGKFNETRTSSTEYAALKAEKYLQQLRADGLIT